MTGRNSTRSRSRGRRTRRGNNNRYGRSGTHKSTLDKKEMKFVPQVAGKSQGYTYETVKEHILQELQKELVSGEEIATNLRKGEDTGIDMPEPKQKIAVKKEMTDEEKKDPLIREDYAKDQRTEQAGLDIEYQVLVENMSPGRAFIRAINTRHIQLYMGTVTKQ